jgi:uncharacterized membrane protein YbhN (UPF0104 family)
VKKYFFFLLKVTVSLGLLFYLFRHTDFQSLWKTIHRINPLWFITAFLGYIIFQMISTLRWQIICKNLGFNQSYIYFLKLYFINQYFNAFLPGLLGGDIIRIGYLLKDGATKTAATLSVFYDRAFGFLGALFLILLCLPFMGDFLPTATKKSLYLVTSMGLLVSFFLVILESFCRDKLKSYYLLAAARVFALRVFVVLFVLGLLVQILYSAHLFFLSRGLGLPVPLSFYLIIVPIVGVLAAMPVSLGGLGVREGTLAYFLKFLGFGTEYGLALGILVYAVALLGGLIGGVVYFTRGSLQKANIPG